MHKQNTAALLYIGFLMFDLRAQTLWEIEMLYLSLVPLVFGVEEKYIESPL